MPDLDIFNRHLARKWIKPGRMLRGGAATPEEVSVAVCRALAESLRYGGGLQDLSKYADVMHSAALGNTAAVDALEQVRQIEQASLGHTHTRIAARAVSRMIVDLVQGEPLSQDPSQAVTEQFCWEMVEFHLFGRLRPELVGGRFANHEEALIWETACKDAMRSAITKMAARLVKDPTAAGLKAPAMKASHHSTADMLYQPIV